MFHKLIKQHDDLVDRLEAMVVMAGESDQEPSPEDLEKRDELRKEIEALEPRIENEKRLREYLEKKARERDERNKPVDKPLVPGDPKEAAQSRGGNGQQRKSKHVFEQMDHTFRSMGDFLFATAHASDPKMADLPEVRHLVAYERETTERLLKEFRATGQSEGIQSDGGFLVPQEFSTTLWSKTYEAAEVLNRCDQMTLTSGANAITIPAVDETSRASGSRWGGITVSRTAEAAAKSASTTKFRQLEIKLHKMTGLLYATDELLADAGALTAWVNLAFAREFDFVITNEIIRGTGAGETLGLLNSAALVSVAKEGGQPAATVKAKNVIKMWSRCYAPCRRNAVWLINQDIEPELATMDLPVGTGGTSVYLPAGGLSADPYSRLYNRPVIELEQCSTLGTVGDIILVDLSQMLMVKKGVMETATSIHVKFEYDETVFRFVLRINGQLYWSSALTPFQGSKTLSPVVAVATRA